MANKYYEPGADRGTKVRDLFSAIARRYDLINDLQSLGLHRFWKRRVITLAQAGPHTRVLDLCCGTGDLAIRFARSGAAVVGLDFSASMLAIARDRCRREGCELSLIQGDALNLPFGDNSFEVVTIAYGLRNLADFRRGLAEIQRVLKPGGKVLVLDFGKPRNRIVRSAYFCYLDYWVPVFGRLLCGDAAPYEYIAESLRHYPAQDGVASLMRELGYEEVGIENLLFGIMSINLGRKPRKDPACP